MLRLVNKCRVPDAAFDIDGSLGPAKGFGVVVPVTEPVHYCSFETADAVETPAANSLAGNYREPAFSEVQAGRAARREVQADPRMGASQPRLRAEGAQCLSALTRSRSAPAFVVTSTAPTEPSLASVAGVCGKSI